MGAVVLGFPGGSPPPPPRPLLRATIGDVLRRTRQAQGRTLADVARAGGSRCPTCPSWSAG